MDFYLFIFLKGLIVLLSVLLRILGCGGFVFGYFGTLFDVDVSKSTINYW